MRYRPNRDRNPIQQLAMHIVLSGLSRYGTPPEALVGALMLRPRSRPERQHRRQRTEPGRCRQLRDIRWKTAELGIVQHYNGSTDPLSPKLKAVVRSEAALGIE